MPPESFLVTKDTHLEPGEDDRARAWAAELGAAAGVQGKKCVGPAAKGRDAGRCIWETRHDHVQETESAVSSTASPTATLTVLFCDVVGSTERLVRIGDVAGDSLRRDLFAGLRRSVLAGGGTEVKNLGDGLMVVFPRSAVGALVCARDMHRAAAAVDGEDPIQLRIGISAGEVAEEDGDWFGLPVVEAARLCGAAASGQTLATALIRTLVGTRADDHRIVDVGSLTLKGLAAPVATVEISWRADESSTGHRAEAAAAPFEIGSYDRTSTDRGGQSGGGQSGGGQSGGGQSGGSRTRRLVILGAAGVAVISLLGLGIAMSSGGEPDTVLAGETTLPLSDAVTEPDGYEPEFRATPCTPQAAAAAPGAECGELIVPESRTNPAGRSLVVPVMKKSAVTDTGAAPVVLVDPNESLATTSLSEVADVYSLSLRGFTAGVGPDLECDELRTVWEESLSARADDPQAVDRKAAAAAQCAQRLRSEGVQLEGYNMAEVAGDVRDLVRAADLGQVTVAGGGFASPALLSFVRSNPGAVGAMVLTNPVSTGSSPLEDPAASLAATLSRLVDLCAADPGCAVEHPDLEQRYRARYEELAATPVSVVTNSLVGTGPHAVMLDGRRWAAALEAATWQSGRLGLVPQAIESADDELIAAASIDEEVKGFIGPGSRAGAMLSYTCSNDAAPNLTAEISASAMPAFAGANEASVRRMCSAWDVPSVYDELSKPLYGPWPTFLSQGSLAVAGTKDWAGETAGQLESATVARFATMSEDLAYASPPCLRKLRNEFVVDPTAPLEVGACEKSTPSIDFVGAN